MKNKFVKILAITSILSSYIGSTYAAAPLIASTNNNEASNVSQRPILTTAGIVHKCPEDKIILIERGKAPFGFAMFGGHVEYESPENAFIREAKEELNVDVEDHKLVGVYGTPGRDPRQHSVEVTFSAVTSQIPFAGSDAKKTHLFSRNELKLELAKDIKDAKMKFAFDHRQILKDYLNKEILNPCVTIIVK